jgi:hypothetical protein
MVGGIIKGVAALASLSIGGPAGAAIGYAVGHRDATGIGGLY